MRVLVVLLAFIFTLNAAQIDEFATTAGYERNYQKALASARDSNSPLMLLVVADYCPWCKKLERKVLEDPQVIAKVKASFKAIVVDKVHDKESFPAEFNAKLIPAIYFIDPKTAKSFYEISTYMNNREFELELTKVLAEFKR
jgi:thioredoxin-related protein